MPDLMTRYPDTAQKVFESGRGQCTGDREPRILKDCPHNQLCVFPGGEVCVYGLNQIRRIPQMPTPALRERLPTRPSFPWYESPLIFLILVPLLLGFFGGLWFERHGSEALSEDEEDTARGS